MKRILLSLALVISSFNALAEEPARVMFFGTFHFKDAGLDLAKVEDFNVMDEAPQAYIEDLTGRLASFRPTHVLLEYSPANEEVINERYRNYLDGSFELPANEIYQLGFRIAAKAGLERVHSFDHRDVPWQAEAMFEYAEKHDSPEIRLLNEVIAEHVATEEKLRKTLGLGELLARHNDPGLDHKNMAGYIMTNPIGAGDGYSGADAAASWWQRNFRMYANVQKIAHPGTRVIAIAGSGHTAILKHLLDLDPQRKAEHALPYIEGTIDAGKDQLE